MNRIRIMLADDHSVVRQGFRAILSQQADMQIVGEASNGREAMSLAEELKPDVIVMDVAMPELNGIEAARRLGTSIPNTRVLALSMHKDSVYVREMLKAGARGYLLKDAGEHDLLEAVRAVARGGEYISPSVQSALDSRYKMHGTTPLDLLTSREREVLQLIAEGKTNKEVAVGLNISVFTVDAHRGRIMEKLNVHNVNELGAVRGSERPGRLGCGGRLVAEPLQKVCELAFGRFLQLVQFGFLALRIGCSPGVSIGQHQVVVGDFSARLNFHCLFEQRYRVVVSLRIRPQLRDGDERFREVGPQFGGLFEMRSRFGLLLLRGENLRDLIFGDGVSGIQFQFDLELFARLLQRRWIVRLLEQRAPETVMQVNAFRVLRDRLAIFGNGFGVFSLCFEDFGRELVHAI